MVVGELNHFMADSIAPSRTVLTPKGLHITGEFFLTVSTETVP